MAASTNLLHVQNLNQGFGGKMVLDNINLSVKPGEFVTLVGPSGCGKSTLLRIIIGQDRPLSGEVLLEGRSVGSPDSRRGVVYQHYSLFPNLTALENVVLGKRLGIWPWQWWSRKAELRDEAMFFLEKAGMAEHAHKHPHQLSGGQRQRAAIAQTLIQQPKVLCMDEPFSALDPGTRESMQMFLLELWEELMMTIFFITHDLEEAVFLGTRLVALSQYYTDDRGEGENVNRGSKIVVDRAISPLGRAYSPGVKATADFGQLIQDMRQQAFDPEYCQHVREFELTHPHAWHTSREGQSR
jgi:NitT/TauT family transport system ATP-binding protein